MNKRDLKTRLRTIIRHKKYANILAQITILRIETKLNQTIQNELKNQEEELRNRTQNLLNQFLELQAEKQQQIQQLQQQQRQPQHHDLIYNVWVKFETLFSIEIYCKGPLFNFVRGAALQNILIHDFSVRVINVSNKIKNKIINHELFSTTSTTTTKPDTKTAQHSKTGSNKSGTESKHISRVSTEQTASDINTKSGNKFISTVETTTTATVTTTVTISTTTTMMPATTTSAAGTTTVVISDSNLNPQSWSNAPNELDAKSFWTYLTRWAKFKHITDEALLDYLPLIFKNQVLDWFENLPEDGKE